jgi:hypothetical protein
MAMANKELNTTSEMEEEVKVAGPKRVVGTPNQRRLEP